MLCFFSFKFSDLNTDFQPSKLQISCPFSNAKVFPEHPYKYKALLLNILQHVGYVLTLCKNFVKQLTYKVYVGLMMICCLIIFMLWVDTYVLYVIVFIIETNILLNDCMFCILSLVLWRTCEMEINFILLCNKRTGRCR